MPSCDEPFSNKIITCNGRSKDLSVIDPVEGKRLSLQYQLEGSLKQQFQMKKESCM